MAVSGISSKIHTSRLIQNIEAIFFDVGDTLRTRVPDQELHTQAGLELYALVHPSEPQDIFLHQLDDKYRDYQIWRRKTMIEITEKDLWIHWMLPDLPPEQIIPIVDRLMDLYRQRSGRAVWMEGAERVISELHAREYRLAIISNTISRTETPQALEEAGLSRYFDPVILSTTFGKRKPDPELFLHAARLAHVAPVCCAYVGDQPSRDVVGSKRAGLALSIILAQDDRTVEALDAMLKPDITIRRLDELLDIFQTRVKK